MKTCLGTASSHIIVKCVLASHRHGIRALETRRTRSGLLYDLLFPTCWYIYLDNSFNFFYICTNHFSWNILEAIEFASNWLLHLIIVATVRRHFVQFSQSPKVKKQIIQKALVNPGKMPVK